MYQSPYLRCVGAITHQDALVDVPVVAGLHADPDNAGVRALLVVDGPGGAGARRLRAPAPQGAGAEVGVGGAGGEGGALGAGGGEGVFGYVVQRAGQRLRGEEESEEESEEEGSEEEEERG